MPKTFAGARVARRGRVSLLATALVWAAVGDARAQSSAAPPPTAPSAAPLGGATTPPGLTKPGR